LSGFVADHFQSYIPAFFIFGGVVVFAGALPFCLCFGSSKITRLESEEAIEVQLKLIGSRLANTESSLNINIA
jgi:hypothetical protein